MVNRRTAVGILAMASVLAFGVTAYGTQASGQGNGAKDPTAVASFDRAGVGGRKGCEIQSWPYIAPECLASSDGHVRAVRRLD